MDHVTEAQSKDFDSAFGKVTCTIPSIKQRLEVSKRMQRYSEALFLASGDWDLIEAMSLLDVIVTDAPDEFKRDKATGGWDYDQMYDIDEIISLGKEVKTWVESFRNSVRGK